MVANRISGVLQKCVRQCLHQRLGEDDSIFDALLLSSVAISCCCELDLVSFYAIDMCSFDVSRTLPLRVEFASTSCHGVFGQMANVIMAPRGHKSLPKMKELDTIHVPR